MGKSLAELHSAIISSDVTRKSGDVRGCVAREESGWAVPEVACEWCSALAASGVKRCHRARCAAKIAYQFKASLTMQPRTKMSSAAATSRFNG
ncbi:hypothetical protein P0D88_28950 [Paraburkholderia sp. RL18-103-BIB-C]|jgi:hypothetical protein|uniref:hypothetical protein n=1 Tax=unclassified Paraburkholderia TaxID=2615204 RepID=UPI002F4DD86F